MVLLWSRLPCTSSNCSDPKEPGVTFDEWTNINNRHDTICLYV